MSNSLSKLAEFIRLQLSGAPADQVEAAVAAIAEHVDDEIKALEARFVERLDALSPTPLQETPAPVPDTGFRDELAALAKGLEEIREKVAHALSTPARAAAPAARASAPTARPAA